ncbi:MAG: DMT family protein [Nitrospirota bacterium]
MKQTYITIIMLCGSNIFMTFAWYGHLKNFNHKPWIIAALVSWGIALFEYLLQVPANRIGHKVLNLGQLKILQEIITLSIFVPFSIFFMKEKLTLNYVWAGICLLGAVFFIFRAKI